MIILLDNRDSFVFNIARYIELLGEPTLVLPSHSTSIKQIEQLSPRGIVISPGPCTPREAGCSVEAIRHFENRVPILGVCLGHQVLAAAYGGVICRASEPVHGRTSLIHHDGRGVFKGLPSPLAGCRYHSLVVDPLLPECLEIAAQLDDGTVMAIRHREWPFHGVQFHPEAILTDFGFDLIANFLFLSGASLSDRRRTIVQEGRSDERALPSLEPPEPIVTF